MKRRTCSNCLRSIKTCYCDSIVKFENSTNIVILQHPQEQKHHLPTALMAKLSLNNVTIIVGENFSENQIINNLDLGSTALLYPGDDSIDIDKNDSEITPLKTLIILDGTWKKTYKILKLSQNLGAFKKLEFSSSTKSLLRLRKVPKSNYLSTYESIIYCLKRIEKKPFNNFESPLKYVQDKIETLSISKEK